MTVVNVLSYLLVGVFKSNKTFQLQPRFSPIPQKRIPSGVWGARFYTFTYIGSLF